MVAAAAVVLLMMMMMMMTMMMIVMTLNITINAGLLPLRSRFVRRTMDEQ